jgi:hypothetical protein
MATLTQEQRELLKQGGQEPLRLIDPESHDEYPLLRAGAYARMQALLSDADPREMYPALHQALRDERRDDPQMDEYNRYGY